MRIPPLLRGMSHLTICLVHTFLCPTPMVSTRDRVEHGEEKEMFRAERHLLYASHASAMTHWEQQKVATAAKKAAKPAKKNPNPKMDADQPVELPFKPAKDDFKPEAKQAPPPAQPKAAPEAAPIEVDAPAQPPAQPPAQIHAPAPDWGKTHGLLLGGTDRPHP